MAAHAPQERRRALPGAHRPRARSFENLPRPQFDTEVIMMKPKERHALLKSMDDNPRPSLNTRIRHLFSRTTSAAPEVLSAIYILPNETLMKVFSFLDAEDLARIGRVCQLWTSLTRHHMLWTILLERNLQQLSSAHPPPPDYDPDPMVEEPIYLSATDVKFASRRHLVELLTAETHGDPIFMRTFLTTYQSFLSAQNLIILLLRRYDLHQHTQLVTHDQLLDDEPPPAEGAHLPMLPIQIRVCNVLRNWVDEFYADFDRSMRSLLALFVRARLIREGHHEVARILRNSVAIARISLPEESRAVCARSYSQCPASKIAPKMLVSVEQWLEWDEEEVARQLTLRDWEQFSAVKHVELLLAHERGAASRVATVVGTFNRTCVGVAHLILLQRDRKERAKAVCKWIRIAEYLRGLNNFHSLVAVLSALGSNAVTRLRHTFAKVPRSALRAREDLQDLMTTNDNYRRYRMILLQTACPAVPFVGLPLRDVAMIEDCNLAYRGPLVNFSQRRLLYNVISQFRLHQQTPYHLVPMPAVVRLLDAQFATLMEENDLWNLSEVIEPKASERR